VPSFLLRPDKCATQLSRNDEVPANYHKRFFLGIDRRAGDRIPGSYSIRDTPGMLLNAALVLTRARGNNHPNEVTVEAIENQKRE
jgi:hypothetical protein